MTPGRAALLHTLTLRDFPHPVVARSLSPNGRVHWAEKRTARESVEFRVCVDARVQNLSIMRGGLVTVRPTFTFPQHRRRDQDNLCTGVTKACLDALVRGGWLQDDSSEYVRLEPPVVRVEKGVRSLVLEFWA